MRYACLMRGGVQVWKRGVNGHGLRHATAYALQGGCDAKQVEQQVISTGADAAAQYGPEGAPQVTVYRATADGLQADKLDADKLRSWIDGRDPQSGEQRGRAYVSPESHLLYDSTINAPKTYSLAGVLHPELREEFEALMQRVTEQTVISWREELSTRRGSGGRERIELAQIEVVQLDHERSRSLDPHAHRHLWLNAKVLGADGKWSNVDSQQVFRMQALVNARGELAARTDQRWREALARYGYTLNNDGEIAQLAHVVRPMSKRAAQIESNKRELESQWREQNPGHEPSPRLIEAWDRQAWAMGRAQKPGELDEAEWAATVRSEIASIDPAAVKMRAPVSFEPASLAEPVDFEQLSAHALSVTDQRAVRSQGRFSRVDLRAGATMAVAHLQLTWPQERLNDLVRQTEVRALAQCETLSSTTAAEDVKALRLTEVGQLRTQLSGRAALRAQLAPGEPASNETLARGLAAIDAERAQEGSGPLRLDDQQTRASAIVAGTAALSVIEGPAGAGKTTMLSVAERALRAQGREMVTVAPTMKAAQVAASEIGNTSSSLHSLLFAHGWRWHEDKAGKTQWRRLNDGDMDIDGSTFYHPAENEGINAATTIVCDEAGMVDLEAMNALMTLADERGSRLVLVGDSHQVRPVGHSGAMGLVAAQLPENARGTLHSIHRFRAADGSTDHAYADISRQMRTAQSSREAHEVAQWLIEHDRVRQLSDSTAQVHTAAQAWLTAHGRGESIAITADTNEIVDAINQSVQRQRLEAGQVGGQSTEINHGQQIYVGDTVVSRLNYRGDDFSVVNRETWKVTAVNKDSLVLVGGLDSRTETVSLDYAREHLDLGYASTVHGAQGVTAHRAMTLLSEQTTAAQLYVGMTRGKHENTVLVIGDEPGAINGQLAEAMLRGRDDLTDEQLRALVDLETERAGHMAQAAEREAHTWRERPMGRLTDPTETLDRLTSERDHLAHQAQQLADRLHLSTQRIREELQPAVDVAHRDGLPQLEVATRERQLAAVKSQSETTKAELATVKTALNAAEVKVSNVLEEIEHRALMSPDQRRKEDDERNHAVIFEPARPTDTFERPYGLTLSLSAAHKQLEQTRAEHTAAQRAALVQLDAAGREASEARQVADEAAELLHTIQTTFDARLETRHGQVATAISEDLSELEAARERFEKSGFLRRSSRQRELQEKEGAFITTWGNVPEPTEREAWVQRIAAERSQAELEHSETYRELTEAKNRSTSAQDSARRATQHETSLNNLVVRSKAALKECDAQEKHLKRERDIRANMSEDMRAKENRLRGVHNNGNKPHGTTPQNRDFETKHGTKIKR